MNSSVASIIDHTILRPDAVRADVLRICEEARAHRFASVCVNGFWVPLVASEMEGTGVKVCSVIGFPLGAMTTEAKLAEAEDAVRKGSQELDMVLNIGALKGGELEAAQEDIAVIARVCHSNGAILKVILETALLSEEQKITACRLAIAARADFVKTSTGFGPSGATAADVALLRRTVGPDAGVKASGGIRTYEQLAEMVNAGASRIGASASVAIVQAAVK